MNLTILTTRLNFQWTSMQEIIPNIEKTWNDVATNEGFSTKLINADEIDLKKELPFFLKSDFILITAFNANVAKIINTLRKSLSIDAKFVFYLHGLSTIGLWPLQFFDCLNSFKKSDIFISTSTKDKNCFELSFKNALCEIIPFVETNSLLASKDDKSFSNQYIYIGRISPQKNLHTLIWAFHIINKTFNKYLKLEIFGAEDHYGSPNMDIINESYLEYLKNLIEKYDIKNITFHGFVDREVLFKNHVTKDKVFISPSIHSDENFGMAAFTCLQIGLDCILSNWGGHSDLSKENLVSIYNSPIGPFIDFNELVNSILSPQKSTSQISNYDCEEKIRKILLDTNLSNEKLELTDLAKAVYSKRQFYEKNNQSRKHMRIFENYCDPISHIFFKAYGAKSNSSFSYDNIWTPSLLPWVNFDGDSYLIDCPHRGSHKLKLSNIDLFKYGLCDNLS